MSSHAIVDARSPSASIVDLAGPATDHMVQLFHTLVEEARGYGIFLLDPEGLVASWNAGAARIMGYSETEIIGQHHSCFYIPEAIQEGHPAMALEKALAEGKYQEEGWRIRRDGSRFWANVLITPVRDDNGRLTGFARFVQDATEARQAKEALLESEQRLTLAFRASEEGVWDWNMETGAVWYSPHWQEMLGYQEGEIEAHFRTWEALLHPEDKAGAMAAVQSVIDGERDYQVEFRLRHKDGHYVPILSRGLPMRRDDGRVTRMVGTHLDLTERKRAEQALRRSERTLRSMADAMPHIVWTAGDDGEVNYHNRQWSGFVGACSEFVPRSWVSVVHPDEIDQVTAAWQKAVVSREPFEMQCRLLDCRDGAHRWYLVRAVYSDSGMESWIGTCTDIDDFKRLSDDLEVRVNERTMALQQSIHEKTMLLKEVHHRVKNNLQVVCSLLSMQIRSNQDEKCASHLIAAHSRALAMSLVHEQVYQSQSVADLDFGRYIEQLAEQVFCAYCVDPKRIQLELNIESISLTIEDAVPCGLILNELLSNSLKHAFVDGRQGVIRVSFRRTEGEEVECSVKDNGPGLPLDFDLRQSQSLGMQIVSSLIRQLRADLVTSSDGGATVSFRWKCGSPVAEKLLG